MNGQLLSFPIKYLLLVPVPITYSEAVLLISDAEIYPPEDAVEFVFESPLVLTQPI